MKDKPFQSAWQPLTPRGINAFARASLGRLLLVQSIAAVLTAITVVWFLNLAWFPVVREAIRQLPAAGEIRRGELVWRGDSPVRLAGGQFLSLAVDLWHEGDLGNESHLSVELGRKNIRVRSLLGYAELKYPAGWTIALNRAELLPWWGAWQPWVFVGAAVTAVGGLFLSWAVLAAIYSLLVRLFAFFTNRDLNWPGGWKLAAAALMPGALFMTLTIVAYGLGLVDLVQLGAGFGFHFIIGWIYLPVCLLLLPRRAKSTAPKNPFAQS